ncbi:MAG TPA: M10 family metallopeptidase [Microvirga sp.]|jgi:serralysin
MPSSVRNEKTGIWYLDALMAHSRWQDGPMTYSFPASSSSYEPGYQELARGFAQLTTGQMQAVRYILEGQTSTKGGPVSKLMPVEGFTNLSFVDAGFGAADMRVARWDTDYSYGFPPGMSSAPAYKHGDVWMSDLYWSEPMVGDALYQTLIHEFGHALGLTHTHEYGVGAPLPADWDGIEYSVMSYRSYPGSPTTPYPWAQVERYGYAQTYMMYDVAALQQMYGADFGLRKTNTVYRWSPTTGETFVNGVGQGAPADGSGGAGNRIFLTLWDGGGRDTYDFSNYSTRVVASLEPGSYVTLSSGQRAKIGDAHYARGNIFNALQYQGDPRSLIENLVGGSASDKLTGNGVANVLKGGAGNDVLHGEGGGDTLIGGVGRDTLAGGEGFDRFRFDTIGESFGRTSDTIKDFVRGVDRIDLSRVDADQDGTEGNQAFKFIGSKAFTGRDGQLRFKDGVASGDVDGDKVADFAIKVAGLKALSAADFVL